MSVMNWLRHTLNTMQLVLSLGFSVYSVFISLKGIKYFYLLQNKIQELEFQNQTQAQIYNFRASNNKIILNKELKNRVQDINKYDFHSAL